MEYVGQRLSVVLLHIRIRPVEQRTLGWQAVDLQDQPELDPHLRVPWLACLPTGAADWPHNGVDLFDDVLDDARRDPGACPDPYWVTPTGLPGRSGAATAALGSLPGGAGCLVVWTTRRQRRKEGVDSAAPAARRARHVAAVMTLDVEPEPRTPSPEPRASRQRLASALPVSAPGRWRSAMTARWAGRCQRCKEVDYSWAEIGDMLGTTRAAAWQRFARRASVAQKRTRRELLDNPD